MLEEIIQLTNELKAKETFIHAKAEQDFGFERWNWWHVDDVWLWVSIACEQGL